MAFGEVLLEWLIKFWDIFSSSFVYWVSIFFVLPFKDLEMLWILVPIWINFIFTDFFQEGQGTSMGNAITNGSVMLWVGIDWIRFLIRNLDGFSWPLFAKFSICVLLMIAGIIVIYEGIKGKQAIKKVARKRETSYIMLVFSPIIYGVVDLSWRYVIVAFIFFPVFYWIFEWINMKFSGRFADKGEDDPSGLGDLNL